MHFLGLFGLWRRTAMLGAAGVVLAACSVTPEPFTDEETSARVKEDMATIFADQEKIDRPIGFEEAVARALMYNLDYRLKLMEKAVAIKELDVAHYDLLPSIAAEAGYSFRSNDDGTKLNAAADESVTTEPSHKTADLDITWNVLDFGISYIRAHQQADMALIVEERRRQVVHNIVRDVRTSFWRVVAAERNLPKIERLLVRVREALASSEKLLSAGLGNPTEHLTFQKGLLEALAQLESTKRDLRVAKTNLAALMNIHPGSAFSLSVDDADLGGPLNVPVSLAEMEDVALAKRTELRGEAYQSRIYAKESKVAVLQMLPGLNFSTGIHWDDDHYLINNSWATFGTSLTWNILNVFKLPSSLDLADRQVALSKARRLALSMAVISQVHVSSIRYVSKVKEYELAGKRFEVEDRLRAQYAAARQAQRGGELAEIRGDMMSIMARLSRDLAYAGVQEAYGGLFAAMGVDPLPEKIAESSLDGVKTALSATFKGWEQGQFAE